MRRQRLKRTTGCLRCRKRHKKCDERKPICGFCSRWHLLCVWPPAASTSTSAPAPGQKTLSRSSQIPAPVQVGVLTHAPKQLQPHGLHGVPFPSIENHSRGLATLHRFFTNMIGDALPFKADRAYRDLGQGWLEPILSDELVCTSFMAYTSRSEAMKTKDLMLKRSSVQCENRALILLQQRISSEMPISPNTILAACLHFTSVGIEDQPFASLQKLLRGIRSLVETRGGFWSFAAQVSPSILQSALICDFQMTYLHDTTPIFPDLPRPSCPASLQPLHDSIVLDPSIDENCGPEIASVLHDLRVLMLCRGGSSKAGYSSTPATAWYPVLLLQYIDNKLASLQSHHRRTASVTEVIVRCIMLARLAILLSVRQHIHMGLSVVQRLSEAIARSHLFDPIRVSQIPRLACWVCTLVLMTEVPLVTTLDLDQSLVLTLEAIFGEQRGMWPVEWRTQIHEILHGFMWHDNMNERFDLECDRILKSMEPMDMESSSDEEDSPGYRGWSVPPQ